MVAHHPPMQRYAIIGHPVSHSNSPRLHTAAFKAAGIDAVYEAVDVEPADLKERIAELKTAGYGGWNVTIPHKEAILGLLDAIDEGAAAIGAVNTVVNRDGVLTGFNTDAAGFKALCAPFRTSLDNGVIAVLGAGGAARAILHVLSTGFVPKQILILNRTIERAERLAGAFSASPIPVIPESLFQDGLQDVLDRCSAIVNTTSVGMKPYTDASPLEDVTFRKDQVVLDLIYTPPRTALLKAAGEAGAKTAGGLEMFLHQAAEAFRLWTGKNVDMKKVWEAVHSS